MKRRIGRVLYKKLKQIRLAFLYTTLFALFWIPYGVITVWRSYTEDPYRIVINANFTSPKRNVQNCLERVFVTLHPVVYLYTHHYSAFSYLFDKCRRKGNYSLDENNDEVLAVSTIHLETFQASN